MPIDFSPQRWQKIRKDAALWWEGKLNRPLIQVVAKDAAAPGKGIFGPDKNRLIYDLAIPAEELVERWDYELSRCHWLGDCYPHVFVDLGPGVIAAFLGGRPEPRPESVWFHPAKPREIAELELRYDADNAWLRRVMDIYDAGIKRWGSSVPMSMTDLGGNLDIVSSFRPAEGCVPDPYDHPDDVKRVTWDAHRLWWRYFDQFNAVLNGVTPGYSSWTPIYSDVPFYMLQCDFCYMLGPEMFEEFVLPELAASCKRLGNAFYHMDGVGQLAHLDKLLSIPELKGIQWIPGAGKPAQEEWPDVLKRILDAGKLVQLGGNYATMEKLERKLGHVEGIVLMCGTSKAEELPLYEECLRRYGAT